jgi:hypothetical protein
MYVLLVTPNLSPWLSEDDRKRNVVLLDMCPDVPGTNRLRLDLNVIFSPIPVRHGLTQRADYWVAPTTVRVELVTKAATIGDHTEAIPLKATYKNSFSRAQSQTIKLSPSMQIPTPAGPISASASEFSYQSQKQYTFETSYSGSEFVLTPTSYGDRIRWELVIPRGQKIIRDFLAGNLYLYGECDWTSLPLDGHIEVVPDVRFFSPERHPLGQMQSLAMQLILWSKRIRILNRDGFITNFTLESD